MATNIPFDTIDSDVFFAEQLSREPNPQRKNSPKVLNLTKLSGTHKMEMLTISSVTCPEPNIVTLESNSNEPMIPYRFRNQQPIVPPSLNDLSLPPNPFNVLVTMVLIKRSPIQQDEEYCPQSPEPSDWCPISTPPMDLSTQRNNSPNVLNLTELSGTHKMDVLTISH